jgi:hypothetical protein
MRPNEDEDVRFGTSRIARQPSLTYRPVQSREYREQRRMSTLVKTAQRRSLAVKDRLRPHQSIGHDLTLSSASLRSVSQLRFHDPSLDAVAGGIEAAAKLVIGLEAIAELVAQSEIDFRTLEEHIAALLAARGQVTVAELLRGYPAEQGLGTVVGYLALGVRDGIVAEGSDRVSWRGCDGIERSARMPRIYFVSGSDARSGSAPREPRGCST